MERRPLLGIIQLDCNDTTSYSSDEILAMGVRMPFWIGDPSFWGSVSERNSSRGRSCVKQASYP
ncbi:hypothetical protein QFZ91_005164 [Paraburkholderia sp. JPY419]